MLVGSVDRFMYDQNDDPDSIFYKRIDTDAIGMAGYSIGRAVQVDPMLTPGRSHL